MNTSGIQIRNTFTVPMPEEALDFLYGSTDKNILTTGGGTVFELLFFRLVWKGKQRPALTFVPVAVYPTEYSAPLAAESVPVLGYREE